MHPPSLSLRASLPRPDRGGSSRLQFGNNELVLEQVRGGFCLLWSDGREARRYAFGLPDVGELQLELRAPELPVWVVPRETLVLAPGARWCGYVQVPLVPTLTWRRGSEPTQALVVLRPRELATEWDETHGYRCLVSSPLHVRFPMRSGDPKAVVPLRIRNLGQQVMSPGEIPLRIADGELDELRDTVVALPRRLRWDGATFRVTDALATAEASR